MERMTKAELLELLEERERTLEEARSLIDRALGYEDAGEEEEEEDDDD